jgi:nicotinamidase-related amidase
MFMTNISSLIRCSAFAFGACCVALTLQAPAPASAQIIIDEWTRIKPPAPPEFKPVTIDAKDTALLLLDFNGAQDPTEGPCNKNTKPRCLASISVVQKLLAEARAKGLLVVYSLGGPGTTADIASDIDPHATDPWVKSGPDKFLGTDLDKILAGKGIKTVIVTGTAPEGAVLVTATGAALRGMNVIVP